MNNKEQFENLLNNIERGMERHTQVLVRIQQALEANIGINKRQQEDIKILKECIQDFIIKTSKVDSKGNVAVRVVKEKAKDYIILYDA